MLDHVLGWMSGYELKTIESLAKKVPDNGVIVELGSMFGRSSCMWARSKPSATVYCIDTFPEHYVAKHPFPDDMSKRLCFPINGETYNLYQEFMNNTAPYPNITMIRGHSPTDIDLPDTNIDLFFLDANHTNPNDWDNIVFFLPKMNRTGIMCGHDYTPNEFPDVVTNVRRLEGLLGKTATIHQNTSIWSIQL